MFSIFGARKSQVEIYVPNRQLYKIVCTALKFLIQLWTLQIVLSYMYIKVSSVYIIMLILNHSPPPIVKYSWAGYISVCASPSLRSFPKTDCQVLTKAIHCLVSDSST